MRSINSILIIAMALALIGCGKEKVPTSASVIAGEKLFQENCSECHPRSGRGDYLKRIPVTLLIRKSQYELMEWIKGTEQHREMPSFNNFSDEERIALADYLHNEILKKARY